MAEDGRPRQRRGFFDELIDFGAQLFGPAITQASNYFLGTDIQQGAITTSTDGVDVSLTGIYDGARYSRPNGPRQSRTQLSRAILYAGLVAAVGVGIGAYEAGLIFSRTPNTKRRRSSSYNFLQTRNSLSIGARVPEIFGTMLVTPDFIASSYRLYTPGFRRGSSVSGTQNQTEYYLFLLSRGQFHVNRVIYGNRTAVRTNAGTIGDALFTSGGNINFNSAFGAQEIRNGEIIGESDLSRIYYNFPNIQAYPVNSRIRTNIPTATETTSFGLESRRIIIRSPTFTAPVIRADVAIDIVSLTDQFVGDNNNSFLIPNSTTRLASRFHIHYRTSNTGSYVQYTSTTSNAFIGAPDAGEEEDFSFSGTTAAQIVQFSITGISTSYLDIRITAIPFMNSAGTYLVVNDSMVKQVLYYYSTAAVTADQLTPYSDFTLLAAYRNAEAVIEGLDDLSLIHISEPTRPY